MLSPCSLPSIEVMEENASRLENVYYLGDYRQNTRMLIENAKQVLDISRRARQIVSDPEVDLRYCLVPRVGEAIAGKVGGLPNFYGVLGFSSKDITASIKKLWPRCGCCHHRMKYIGSFDLFPWGLPIHALTGTAVQRYTNAKIDEYSIYSGLGNFHFHQHSTIFEKRWYHVFMCCRLTDTHIYYPGYDAEILMSDEHTKITEDEVASALPEIPTELYPTKIPKPFLKEVLGIEKYDFRIQIGGDYEVRDKYEDIETEHPDVFANSYEDFTLFGLPHSQQEERRYHTTNRWAPYPEMTPFINFNKPGEDFTVQIYSDLQTSNGYRVYGKIDGSCT